MSLYIVWAVLKYQLTSELKHKYSNPLRHLLYEMHLIKCFLFFRGSVLKSKQLFSVEAPFSLSASINIHRAITRRRGLPLSTPSPKSERLMEWKESETKKEKKARDSTDWGKNKEQTNGKKWRYAGKAVIEPYLIDVLMDGAACLSWGPLFLSVFRLLPSDWPQRVMRNKQVEASH